MPEKKTNEKNKKTKVDKILNFLTWLISTLVSLSIGAGMATRVLTLEVLFIPSIITAIVGWVVIIGTIISIVLSFFR